MISHLFLLKKWEHGNIKTFNLFRMKANFLTDSLDFGKLETKTQQDS